MDKIDELAKKVWDYHLLHHKLRKADCIFVLCSNDLRVAEKAAELFREGFAPYMVISGGFSHKGDLLEEPWDIPPAHKFVEVTLCHGVPKDKMLIEDKATNTGENISLTRKLLDEKDLHPKKVIAVQKPYMERRAWATLQKQWPEVEFIMASPDLSFEEYPTNEIPKDVLINLMVGDLQRIKEYSQKGFQITQDIPSDVWEAYNELMKLGFNKHSIK